MNPPTIKFNTALIRLAKGMISAWEEWVKAHLPPPTIEINPDPMEHFKQHK